MSHKDDDSSPGDDLLLPPPLRANHPPASRGCGGGTTLRRVPTGRDILAMFLPRHPNCLVPAPLV